MEEKKAKSKNMTMLYKCPGPHKVHGGMFDHTTVPASGIAKAKANGWYLTTPEAKEAEEKRAALAAKAAE
jgi:hypothetical protein